MRTTPAMIKLTMSMAALPVRKMTKTAMMMRIPTPVRMQPTALAAAG
jgi:hypothetical protein